MRLIKLLDPAAKLKAGRKVNFTHAKHGGWMGEFVVVVVAKHEGKLRGWEVQAPAAS